MTTASIAIIGTGLEIIEALYEGECLMGGFIAGQVPTSQQQILEHRCWCWKVGQQVEACQLTISQHLCSG